MFLKTKPFSAAIGLIVLFSLGAQAQLNFWENAGVSAFNNPKYYFERVNCPEAGNCDEALAKALNNPQRPLVVLFPEGRFYFSANIRIPANTQLRGKGRETTLIFEIPENQHCILISGTAADRKEVKVNGSIALGSNTVELSQANAFIPGDLIRVFHDDSRLVMRDWGRGQTGQINKVVEVNGNRIEVESPWRLDYAASPSLVIRKMNPIRDVAIRSLNIIRRTPSSSQVSNIRIQNAHRISIEDVYSDSCVYAHVDVRESRNILITASSFFEAHEYGEGGRGYGVILQAGTAEGLVYDNAFARLRHAMIIQSGGNGNVFAYNHSKDVIASRKVFGFDVFHTLSGDMVVHGNFPYRNIFEGNYSHMGIIDNAHGRNGPGNVFHRNTIAPHGITITNGQSHEQVIIGNQTSGLNWFSARNHQIEGNSHQGEWIGEVRSMVFELFPEKLSPQMLQKMGNGGDAEFVLPAARLHR
jgi:hypothetical protein